MYGAAHKRYSVAKLIKAVSTELSKGMGKHNSHKQKPQWVNVDRIPGLGGAFWRPEGKESPLRRIYYTAGLGGYSVLGTLGSTRVQFIYQCTNGLTERHSIFHHFHSPHGLVNGRWTAEPSCPEAVAKSGIRFSMNDWLLGRRTFIGGWG